MPFNTKINWEQEIPRIRELGELGIRMPALAERYGVSRQRIKQVLDKYIPNWSEKYGSAVHKKEKADARYAKWGVREDSELYDAKRQKFRVKKANSINSGKEWTLEFGDLVWPTHCPILGIELDYFSEKRSDQSVSFDRIDSTKGYVKGNVQIISFRANRIKNDSTVEELHKIASYMMKLSNT
jgi:hypothetical protein